MCYTAGGLQSSGCKEGSQSAGEGAAHPAQVGHQAAGHLYAAAATDVGRHADAGAGRELQEAAQGHLPGRGQLHDGALRRVKQRLHLQQKQSLIKLSA
jgi:hypothetical protein